LAGDVQFLVRSLGGKATITKRMGRYKRNKTYKNTRLNYRVFICLNPKPNFIQDMIYVGEKETVCIKVNHPSELYLTDDFIVTHNTSLATGIANGISELSKTLYFSLELPAKVIQERLLCQQAELNYYQIKKDGIGNSQAALMKAAKVIESRKLYIDDAPFLNPDEFSEIIEKNKIECAIVDYVQLTSSGKWNENRVKEIDVICRDLRAAAKIFNIPVILLAQLNRQVEQRKEHRPLLCDLRDSGAIEQLAQVVLLIHRPSFYEERELGLETEDTWDAELIIAKNYNGATGIVNVGFIPHSMKFVSKGEFE
jgi:replicative DNA helicase